jgi:glucose/arabinose dehydrogenase
VTRDPHRARRLTATLVAGALALTTVLELSAAAPAEARAAIVVRTVATGLDGPAAFTFMPNGRIVYLERGTGEIHFLNPANHKDHRFFKVAGVDGSGERGALGVALHPDWPKSPFLYVYVTRTVNGHLRNQILRIRKDGGRAAGTRILVSTTASVNPYHNGGRIAFGPDGMLYAIVGDAHDSANSQDLTNNLRGKILRIRPNGTVPAGNVRKGSKIYAFGIRNSFGFTWDPIKGSLWETENGPGCNDEINRIRRGGNFGWGPKQSCGSQAAPGDTNNSGPTPRLKPATYFRNPIGITGAAFCDGCGLGAAAEGDLFFGCVNNAGTLRRVNLNGARTDIMGNPAKVLNPPNGAIYSMETAPDGRIFFSDFAGIYRLALA